MHTFIYTNTNMVNCNEMKICNALVKLKMNTIYAALDKNEDVDHHHDHKHVIMIITIENTT